MNGVLENHLVGPQFLSHRCPRISDLCQWLVKTPPVWKESFTWNLHWICSECGVYLERRLHGPRHWGAGNVGRVRKPCSKTHCEEGSHAEKCWIFHIPCRRRNSQVVRQWSGLPKNHFKSGLPCTRPRTRRCSSGRVGRVSTIRHATDDSEARNDVRTIAGNYIYHHHVEPRVQLYVPNEGSLPMPLEYIGIVRRTNTILDVLLEAVLTLVGTLMVNGNYLNLGPVSHSSQCWMKSLQMHTRGPGGGLPKFRQHPGPITYDQECGQVCRTAVNKTNNGIRLWKSRSPTMLEIWNEYLSAIWMAWSSRCWSEPWTSFTQFTMLNEKPPDGCALSGRAADKNSSNIKARSFLARDLVRNDERSSTKRKAAMGHWNVQARQSKKIDLFHRSEWREFKGTMENSRNKLWLSIESAMPCKVQNLGHGEICGENKSNTRRSKYACIVEAHASTRKHIGKTEQKIMKITLLGSDSIRWVIAILCTSSFLCPNQWISLMRKPLCTKKGKNSKNCRHGQWWKSRARERSFMRHRKEGRTVHFSTLMDVCHLKNSEMEQ